MNRPILFCFLLLALLTGCEPDDGYEGLRYYEPAEYPSIKIPGFQPISTSSSEWNFGDEKEVYRVKLNMADYPNAKGVYFQAEVGSTNRRYYAYGRLVNMKTGAPIPGSEIRNYWGNTRSDNLIGFFPNEEIEVSMQVRTENEGTLAQLWANSFVLVVLE